MEGCTTLAYRLGLCGKHGGFYRCSEEGCDKHAVRGGLCMAHFDSLHEICSLCALSLVTPLEMKYRAKVRVIIIDRLLSFHLCTAYS